MVALGYIEEEKVLDLKYIKVGKGNKNAIAFHGFGQDNTYYVPFESFYGEEYTIYCFNLPFHGNDTSPKTGVPTSMDILKTFFKKFFEENQIKGITNIGFSIGAKVSIAILELFPEKIEKMILIALDVFMTNIWYRLGTGSRFSRSLFKYFVKHPDALFRFSDSLAYLGLVHPRVIKFAKSQINSFEKREKVFYTWMFFRKLRFKKDRIIHLLINHRIPVSIFLGKEDKIILKKHFSFLTQNKEVDANLTILQAGHNDLIKETAKYLVDFKDK